MRKKMYFLTLDTETATLPFASTLAKSASEKQKIAIAKPLVYDIGWVISDRNGNIVKEENFLVQETFFVPNVFNTAYYSSKRPIYMDMYAKGLIKSDNWDNIINLLLVDMEMCDFVVAYNACFDYKKAIPFTETYIEKLYSADYNAWEKTQYGICSGLLKGAKGGTNPDFLNPVFNLRGLERPIIDLWGMSCDRLINIDRYRNYCIDNGLFTNSALFFKSSAETSFQYLMKDYGFVESHTALSDAEIETQILTKALKKGKAEPLIKEFPFRALGTTYDYALTKRKKSIDDVRNAIEVYYNTLDKTSRYAHKIENIIADLM